MDVATRIRYLDNRIVYGIELLGLLQRRGQAEVANSLLQQMEEFKREREKLTHTHTPSRNLVVEPLEEFEPWMLREWRRVSIPQWRDVLRESIEQSDAKREEYARWMLREVLLDPDYVEPKA